MLDTDTDRFRQDQRQSWDSVASGWQKWWRTFEKGAQKISDRLIELTEIKPCSKVVDIATGIGEPAITAAMRVGISGHVLATDISPQMLSIAKQRAISQNLQGIIDFKEGDVETIDLDTSIFDAVLCRWGLMFLPNLESGLSNIYESLVDGGRFAAAVWASSDKVPQLSLAIDTARKEINIQTPIPPPSRTPGPFSLADVNILKKYFICSGFKDINIERIIVTFEFDSAEDYTKFTQDIAAPVNALLVNQTLEQKEKIWKAVTKAAATKYGNNQKGFINLDNEAICIVGTK
jgi:ubiquinone/menaquinone biosynthesis C-methylase UbiE